MFDRIAIHGDAADLVFVYHKAASLTGWQILRAKDSTEWKLTAIVKSKDDYLTRQRPLLFTAFSGTLRLRWEVQELHVGDRELSATLGQPV